jgi:hypothetical protein
VGAAWATFGQSPLAVLVVLAAALAHPDFSWPSWPVISSWSSMTMVGKILLNGIGVRVASMCPMVDVSSLVLPLPIWE